MKVSRRLFLGLLGGTIVAAASPAEFEALAVRLGPQPAPKTVRRVHRIWIIANQTGRYSVQRAAGGPGSTLVDVPLHKGGVYCYQSMANQEIILQPGEPMICLEGPDPDWRVDWSDDESGQWFATVSQGATECLDLEP